jgi:hypothetical protein
MSNDRGGRRLADFHRLAAIVIPTFVLGHVHIFPFYFKELVLSIVMTGLDPAIHAVRQGDFVAEDGSSGGAWMPGLSPGLT